MPLEMLVVIIVFVCLSVIFNVVLFIRCCMVNNYLKKLHRGEPRSQCFDQLLCMKNSKLLPNRSRLNYIRMPEHKSSSPLIYPSSPVMSASFRPGSTMFLPANSVTGPIYQTNLNSPVLVRNITTSTAQYETQPGMELIYDDVNHSTTYTSVNPGSKTPTTNPLMPVVSTPDGRTWVLDRTGRVYLPCAQPSFPINYETSATPLAPTVLPYESNGYTLNRIPEYEQDEMFRGPVLLPNKRSATPLPGRPVQSTIVPSANSTPPLIISGGRPGSARDLSRSPRSGNQANLITSLPVSCSNARPTAMSILTTVAHYPIMHPLSVINLSSATNRTTPLPAIPPVSDRAQSIPFLASNPSRLASPASIITSPQLSPTSDRGVMDHSVSTQSRKLLKADPKSYLEE